MSHTSRFLLCLCIAAGLVGRAPAQESPKKAHLTARQLYYSAVQPASPEAPAPKPTSPKSPKKSIATPAVQPPADAPLGLRYTVVKFSGDTPAEVPADTVFHAGDHAQLKVEANSPGYLYVVSQGTTGMWKPVFPSTEVEKGDNHVEALHSYTLPSEEHQIGFDQNAGAEKIFIVLCRQPEPDLEKMIHSLKGGSTNDPPQIDNATVGRIRKAYARDLIIERVNPSTTGEKKETAVYVVNPSGSSSSRVVADLTLTHK